MICVINMINVMDNEQELKKNDNTRKTLVNLLRKYPGIWFLSLFLMPIGVAILAYNQLSYIGYVPQKVQEETPFIPVQSSVSTFSDTSNPLPLWLIMAVIFCCSTGSFVIFYLLQNARESTKTSQRTRNSQKLSSQKRYKATNFPFPPPDRKNLLIILPPEKIYPLNTNTSSVANLQNLCKHSSEEQDSQFP
jgi:cytoskeletal protein RodZ